MHAASYADAIGKLPEFELASVWDFESDRAESFAGRFGFTVGTSIEAALNACDAVIIASENLGHGDLIEAAIKANKHLICEKPIAGSWDEFNRITDLAAQFSGVAMTAFPCPYSTAFERLQQRLAAGDIGSIVSICATNRGTCPFGWFVAPDLSGGGCLIDHVVHVGDLLYRLLGTEPERVVARTGNNMYGQEWEDTAMLTVDYSGGVFATVDSSWSRPKSFKTWGDVMLTVVGTSGVIEVDLFAQEIDVYGAGDKTHQIAGFGSNLDLALMRDFATAITEGKSARASLADGLRASKIALMAYDSLKVTA